MDPNASASSQLPGVRNSVLQHMNGEFWMSKADFVTDPEYYLFSSMACNQALHACTVIRFSTSSDYLTLIESNASAVTFFNQIHSFKHAFVIKLHPSYFYCHTKKRFCDYLPSRRTVWCAASRRTVTIRAVYACIFH